MRGAVGDGEGAKAPCACRFDAHAGVNAVHHQIMSGADAGVVVIVGRLGCGVCGETQLAPARCRQVAPAEEETLLFAEVAA